MQFWQNCRYSSDHANLFSSSFVNVAVLVLFFSSAENCLLEGSKIDELEVRVEI